MRPQAADCGPSSSSRHLFASSVSQRSDASSRALVFGGGPGSGPRAAASDLSLWEGGGGEASVHALEAECLDSLQSSLRAVEKTNRAAQYTAEALNAQAEQLGKIREASSDIDANLEASGYYLKGLSSFWGSLTQVFTGPPKGSAKKPSSSARRSVESPPEAPTLPSDGNARATRTSSSALTGKYCNFQSGEAEPAAQASQTLSFGADATLTRGAFEPELEQGLEKLSSMLGELHGRAAAMNEALREQNAELQDIQMQVDGNREKMQMQQKQIRRILKR